MQLSELSLFLTEKVYLVKEELKANALNCESLTVLSTEFKEEKPLEIKPIVSYKPIVFVFDKKLNSLSDETFRNLVSKGLLLQEGSYSVIIKEDLDFLNLEEIVSTKVILFGVSFSGFQNKYQVTSKGKQLVLFADSMERIASNVDLKRQLWAQLQLMFPKAV